MIGGPSLLTWWLHQCPFTDVILLFSFNIMENDLQMTFIHIDSTVSRYIGITQKSAHADYSYDTILLGAS